MDCLHSVVFRSFKLLPADTWANRFALLQFFLPFPRIIVFSNQSALLAMHLCYSLRSFRILMIHAVVFSIA